MTMEELNKILNSLNVFQYAAVEEKMFENRLADANGYERKTTFYSDFSIAERYGEFAIKDSYNKCMESWKDDIEYFTEMSLVLNWKSWEWHDRGNSELSKLYSSLFEKSQQYAYDNFKGDDLSYYIKTLD